MHNGTLHLVGSNPPGDGLARVAAPDEADLVRRAGAGDRGAFASLYDMHYGSVAGYVFRRTGDPHVTEDLVGETFMSALCAIGGYEDRGVPIRFWLLRIATNAVNRWARSGARRRPMRVVSAGDEPEGQHGRDLGMREENREAAQVALLSLAPKYQTVVALHYLEGLAVSRIGEVLGCSEGTVKSRLSRARKQMERRLASMGITGTTS